MFYWERRKKVNMKMKWCPVSGGTFISLVLGRVSSTWLYACNAYLFFSCFTVQK